MKTGSLRLRLILSTALSAPLLAGAASAQEAAAPAVASAPEQAQEEQESDERLVALGGMIRPFGRGTIRPFAGAVQPDAGRIRSFAGPIMGTAGRIRSFAGRIRSFDGEVDASAGEIQGFAGRIRSFAGDLRTATNAVLPLGEPDPAFWGAYNPTGDTLTASAGRIRSFAGRIRSFEGDFEAMAGRIRSFTGDVRAADGSLLTWAQGADTYTSLDAQIAALVAGSETTWGAAVTARTGKSFTEAFATPMLTKYGIALGDPASLVGLDELGAEMFLLDWYDNLQNYSGLDQVDHWMKAVRWSPALTQNMGQGLDTKIGVLDFTITGGEAGNLLANGGYTDTGGVIHGTAVAGLIAGRHDGIGVMGFAPNASVVNYNPFDATNTANWTDIRSGMRYLFDHTDASGKRVSVINASLGVPGSVLQSGWYTDVFTKDPVLAAAAKSKILVVAAGNDGAVHHKDDKVLWDWDRMPNVIIVGSVDPNNQISEFSNRPGEAAFDKKGGSDPVGGDKLRDRFIVAPGEWMLVSDGQGGVTRMSGTSFATPLVSGTIALIHDRWPWLATHPKDTVNIILDSAKDLGADGTDNVYGVGMLDVEAALSPINWNALTFKRSTSGGALSSLIKADDMLKVTSAVRLTWEATGVYFNLFEDTGDSFRDFNVPMSSKLLGKTVGTTNEQFNAYLQSRFQNWFNAGGKCSNDTDYDCDGVDDGKTGDKENFRTHSFAARMAGFGSMQATAYATPRTYRAGLRQDGVPFDTALALRSPDGGFGLRFGGGSGAETLGAGSFGAGFGLRSDYDVDTGGANPYLGMASGAGYAAADVKLTDTLSVQVGVSRDDQQVDFDRLSPEARYVEAAAGRYRAAAGTMTLNWRADPRLTASLGYTLLSEDKSLLGTRSLDSSDLPGGTLTDAATLGADYRVGRGLSLTLTGTVGRTRAGDLDRQNIAVAPGGLVSSAWQVGVSKAGVVGRHDRLRLTVAQPLHVESGEVAFSTPAVVDRMTGELGDVVQSVALDGGRRRFVAEALYGRTIGEGTAEFNLFGRADLRADNSSQPRFTMGGSFRLGF
jgi:hypothetical protein